MVLLGDGVVILYGDGVRTKDNKEESALTCLVRFERLIDSIDENKGSSSTPSGTDELRRLMIVIGSSVRVGVGF
jgi:hypothetical protein